MLEGMPCRRQHAPSKNPEEEMAGRGEKAHAYPEDREDAEETTEELEHPERRGDACSRIRDVDQNYEDSEQQYKEDIEGE
ncbi:hypothetical protein NDU88_004499 [Pleurodeles waltl]|uniref:Uncharacterized protein n=1 Tax=Pleurodeles waltl TaxID=8319 RepID=A0AAV7W818_PLEWA|nr:hypothetical protein NDU88_004499 [Pleurodeles waltl]